MAYGLGLGVTDGVSEGAGVGVKVAVAVGARVALRVSAGVTVGMVVGEATTITPCAGMAVGVRAGSVCKVRVLARVLAQALTKTIPTRTNFNIRKNHLTFVTPIRTERFRTWTARGRGPNNYCAVTRRRIDTTHITARGDKSARRARHSRRDAGR